MRHWMMQAVAWQSVLVGYMPLAVEQPRVDNQICHNTDRSWRYYRGENLERSVTTRRHLFSGDDGSIKRHDPSFSKGCLDEVGFESRQPGIPLFPVFQFQWAEHNDIQSLEDMSTVCWIAGNFYFMAPAVFEKSTCHVRLVAIDV